MYNNYWYNMQYMKKKRNLVMTYPFREITLHFYDETRLWLDARHNLLVVTIYWRIKCERPANSVRTRNFLTVSSRRAFDFRSVIGSHLKRRRSSLSSKTERSTAWTPPGDTPTRYRALIHGQISSRLPFSSSTCHLVKWNSTILARSYRNVIFRYLNI